MRMSSSCVRKLRIYRIGLQRMVALALLMVSLIAALPVWAQTFDEAKATYEHGDYAIAFESFRALAEQGDADAQYNLGLMDKKGVGVPQDDLEAARLWRQAAEQGHAEAQCNLGVMYDEGRGVLEDAKEAVRWFRQAAEQGLAEAQFNLGLMYAQGRGVMEDAGEAIRWYRQAAEQGHAEAQYKLGVMYQGGLKLPNIVAVSPTQYKLVYAEGRGMPEDAGEAVRWFRQAAEQGLAEAQYKLGVMYAEGRGVPEDAEEAVRWFRQAAEQDHAKAQWWLRLRGLVEDDP